MRKIASVLFAVSVAAIASGCEPEGYSPSDRGAANPLDPFKFNSFPLMVQVENGARPEKLNSLNNARFVQLLERLDNTQCKNADACAKRIDARFNNPKLPGPNSLERGIGGSRLLTLAKIAKEIGNVGPSSAGVGIKGQIQKECLDANGQPDGREGFMFDSATGDLRICVVVQTSVGAGANMKTYFEYFETHAVNAAAEMDCINDTSPRCVKNGATANNVFPVAAKATGIEISTAKTQPVPGVQMQWKLFAWGTNIKLKRYGMTDVIMGPNPAPVWDANNLFDSPKGPMANILQKLFAPSDEACIDMMFVNPPPATLSGNEPVIYCLGRCKQPPMVNTL